MHRALAVAREGVTESLSMRHAAARMASVGACWPGATVALEPYRVEDALSAAKPKASAIATQADT